MTQLALVTATIDRHRAEPCLQSWRQHATIAAPPIEVVEHGDPWKTTVDAFGQGVDRIMRTASNAEVIGCLHDDLVILDYGWDELVLALFEAHPEVGLAGFVGVESVGTADLGQAPYAPTQLARGGMVSRFVALDNKDDDPHHQRGVASPIASLDGVALFGRRAFWSGFTKEEWRTKTSRRKRFVRPWVQLAAAGFAHYWTDDALSCLAKRGEWQVFYVPVRGRHLGGLTIRDPRYLRWAEAYAEGGDRGFYEAAHRLAYEQFRDVLPLRREDDVAPAVDTHAAGEP